MTVAVAVGAGRGDGSCLAVGTDRSAVVVSAAVAGAVGARAAGSAQEASAQESNKTHVQDGLTSPSTLLPSSYSYPTYMPSPCVAAA